MILSFLTAEVYRLILKPVIPDFSILVISTKTTSTKHMNFLMDRGSLKMNCENLQFVPSTKFTYIYLENVYIHMYVYGIATYVHTNNYIPHIKQNFKGKF